MPRRPGRPRATAPAALAALAVLAAVLVAAGVRVLAGPGTHEERTMQAEADPRSDVTAQDLAAVARARVFFGHQSVGVNLLDAVPEVYRAHGMTPPPIGQAGGQTGGTAGPSGGFVGHAFIGENEKPMLKLQAFSDALRAGLGEKVDVAVMKFCYIDLTATTDVDALFAAYRDTLAALAREYPKVTFVASTVPLTTEPGMLSRLKARFTGEGRFGPAENVTRERFNRLVRAEYADGHLFDIAAVESTTPDGARVVGRRGGATYSALYQGYASDLGHLNADGSRRAAAAWLKSVAGAVAR